MVPLNHSRPTVIVLENKTRVCITLAGFSPRDGKNVPCSLIELLVNFREESSGTGRFCRVEFQRMAIWASFDNEIETRIIIRIRWPVSCNSSCLDQQIELGPVGHRLELRACKIGQSH